MNLAATLPTTWRIQQLKRAILTTAIAAFFGAICLVGIGGPTSAHADTHIIEYHNEDGSVIEIYQDDNGKLYAWGTEADGEQWSYTFDDNPNPDDPSSNDGAMTPEKLKELIKKYAGEMSEPEEAFWESSFGKYLADNNDGIVPVHNPADIAKTYDEFGGTGGPGFDPNGGDIIGQLGKPKGEPADPNEGEDDRDDFGTETPKTGMFEDDMPGPPELINPNPVRLDERTVGDPFVGDPFMEDDDDDDELDLEALRKGLEVQP